MDRKTKPIARNSQTGYGDPPRGSRNLGADRSHPPPIRRPHGPEYPECVPNTFVSMVKPTHAFENVLARDLPRLGATPTMASESWAVGGCQVHWISSSRTVWTWWALGAGRAIWASSSCHAGAAPDAGAALGLHGPSRCLLPALRLLQAEQGCTAAACEGAVLGLWIPCCQAISCWHLNVYGLSGRCRTAPRRISIRIPSGSACMATSRSSSLASVSTTWCVPVSATMMR